jgi:hypothetical protein
MGKNNKVVQPIRTGLPSGAWRLLNGVLDDAKKALAAIRELYSEDTPQVNAQKRVIEYLESR